MQRELIETPRENGHASAPELEALEAQLVEVLEARPIEPEISCPAGPAAAAILATGLASFVLGALTTLVAASSTVTSRLTFTSGAGELSGVSTVTVAVFLVSWAVMTVLWRRSNPPLRTVA